jgi:Calcineurin-like phosphoesterase
MDAEQRATPIVNYETVAGDLSPEETIGGEEWLDRVEGTVQAEMHGALAQVELALKAKTTDPDVLAAPTDPVTARFQTLVAEKALDEGLVERLLPGGQAVKFSRDDWARWTEGFLHAALYRPLHQHRFVPPPQNLEPMGDRVRLALFSDWGTGLYGAPRIAKAISDDSRGFDYVIHLGDVYYTGFEDEIERNLVADWPSPEGGAVNRALNGNHEMYSGGSGYFRKALPWLGQSSSVFALANENWLVVGLDSAYVEWTLADGQAEWLFGLLANAGSRRLVVMTHHQLFSNTAEHQGEPMQVKLASVLQ